jgi:hypothetical protein
MTPIQPCTDTKVSNKFATQGSFFVTNILYFPK